MKSILTKYTNLRYKFVKRYNYFHFFVQMSFFTNSAVKQFEYRMNLDTKIYPSSCCFWISWHFWSGNMRAKIVPCTHIFGNRCGKYFSTTANDFPVIARWVRTSSMGTCAVTFTKKT